MFNPGIVICSRLASSRLPNKAHLEIENRTIIGHLVDNIKDLNLPVVVTVPRLDFHTYLSDETMPRGNNILIHASDHDLDPLARTSQVARQFDFDPVIRITHDKVFIDTDALIEALKVYKKEKAEYLYCSNLIPGTNFEIMSKRSLFEASQKYKNVEYISYAIRDVSKKTINYTYNQCKETVKGLSLLLDYEDDYKLFQVLYSKLGHKARLNNVLNYIYKNKSLININKKPLLTVYTCAFNSSQFLNKAIDSVIGQSIFNDCEYILIDDYSSDNTFEQMAKVGSLRKNISYYRNNKNIGLASSSNLALSKAKGKYILRLDADDYLINEHILKLMYEVIEFNHYEILYPDNHYGSLELIQKGSDQHHVGGALFSKAALNYIKFTDGLRGYEGYDLFLRAKDRLKIGYYKKPAFFYTQRASSMSKTDLSKRELIKKEIEKRVSDEKKI